MRLALPRFRRQALAAAFAALAACQSPGPASTTDSESVQSKPPKAASNTPTPAAVKLDTPRVQAARKFLADGDAESAQSEYARACAEDPNNPAAFLGFGHASYRLFQAAVADPRRGNALLYLQDAASGYRKSSALDAGGVEAPMGLSRVLREQGDGPGAAAAAQRARDHVAKDASAALRFEVLTELGKARSLEFLTALRDKASPVTQGEIYQRAIEAFRSAKAVEPSKTEPVLEMANLELSRGASSAALDVVCDAVKSSPEETAYHKALCDIGLRYALLTNLVEAYEVRLAKLQSTSPTVCWYSGYVKTREAEGHRMVKEYGAAWKSYDTAFALFGEAAKKKSEFAASVKSSQALAIAGQARCLFEEGKFDEAAAKLTTALRADVGMADVNDGLGISAKRTSLELGGNLFKEGELEKGAQLFEVWLSLTKDGIDVDWLNNAGLLRRDLGEELTRNGKLAEARKCFELSYEHYSKVAKLRPDEPRLVNDAALILLYHLDRDLDNAEAMFRRAIELGEAKLEELGDRPDDAEGDAATLAAAEQWDYFAEATGDACQNLALLLWKRQGDSAQIRKHFARAFELDPRGTRAFFRTEVKSLPETGPAPKWDKPLR